MSERRDEHEEIVYDRRENRIARRLARRAIRAVHNERSSLDVRGPLNIRRVYSVMSFQAYHDNVYSLVNEKLSDQGINVTRTSPSISYWGIGCYIFGHNHLTIKHFDRMHVSKSPPSDEDKGEPTVPEGPDFVKEIPLYVPPSWATMPAGNTHDDLARTQEHEQVIH